MTFKVGVSTIAVLVFVALANDATAATISIGSEKDANMIQTNPTNTAGGNPFVGTGRNQNGATRRGLIQFDVDFANSGIPAGSTINSVSLTLYLRAWSGSGSGGLFGNSRNVFLHQVANEWGNGGTIAGMGGGQGAPSAQDGDVSWNNRWYKPTHPAPPTLTWTNPGGDFDATGSASLVITSATGLNGPVTWTGAGLVSDVQAWVDGADNYGWILLIPNDQQLPVGTLLEFYSKEETNTNLRPALTIDYTAAVAVPEPATWALAAIGLVALGWVGRHYRRRDRAA